MIFVHTQAVAFHLRQQIPKLGEVVRVKVPKSRTLAEARLAGQDRTRLAGHPTELSFERFTQEPRRLGIQSRVLNPFVARLGVLLNFLHWRENHRLAGRSILLELGLAENLFHTSL